MGAKTAVILMCGLTVLAGSVGAMTVEEVIAANLEAKGGEAAWQALEAARMKGTMRMAGGEAGAIEMPFTVEFKQPDKVRLEFVMQGMTAIQAFDGEVGWAVLPFMGKTEPEEMAEDQVKQLKNQADFKGPLVDYKAKGHTVELVGTKEVDGTPAYELKVTRADGDVDVLYLDEEYFVEFKSEVTREIQGQEMTITTDIGDYKEVDGLLFPHSMEMSFGGGEVQQVITINSIETGIELPDDRFAMPVTSQTEEAASE